MSKSRPGEQDRQRGLIMKKLAFQFFMALLIMPFVAGNATAQNKPDHKTEITKNKVIVLGMIHGGHLTSKRYSLPFLRRVIKNIDPDYVLAEIPPDRLAKAMAGYVKNGVVSEARVSRFPEYKDVLFPLSEHEKFNIIATAGWTSKMANVRRKALEHLSKDPNRAQDWQAYVAADKAMNAKLKGHEDDPFFINSDAYDAIAKEGLIPYAKRFANDLGRGDWQSINKAHYTLIEAALDNHSGEGATMLITYGAGHKYWFLEHLRQRDDILLVNPAPYLKAAMQHQE